MLFNCCLHVKNWPREKDMERKTERERREIFFREKR